MTFVLGRSSEAQPEIFNSLSYIGFSVNTSASDRELATELQVLSGCRMTVVVVACE